MASTSALTAICERMIEQLKKKNPDIMKKTRKDMQDFDDEIHAAEREFRPEKETCLKPKKSRKRKVTLN